MSPADATFSLLSCPHPPTRARRALFPAGRGRFLLCYCKGLRPLHPPGLAGRGTGSAGVGGARRLLARLVAGSTCRSGTRRGACRLCRLSTLPFACFPAPIPLPALAERSSRREGGDFCYFIARGFAPCIPGAGGARHWFGFEETILFGIAGGRRLQLQSITNSRKVLGGLGASFKKPPTFLRSPVPSFSRS